MAAKDRVPVERVEDTVRQSCVSVRENDIRRGCRQKVGQVKRKDIKHFIFQAPQKAFTCRIIRGTSFLGHGPGKTSTLHAFDPSGPPVMTAAISMDDGVLSLCQSSNCLIQHGIDQSGIGAVADCPVHNQTIETVYERRETGWPEGCTGHVGRRK